MKKKSYNFCTDDKIITNLNNYCTGHTLSKFNCCHFEIRRWAIREITYKPPNGGFKKQKQKKKSDFVAVSRLIFWFFFSFLIIYSLEMLKEEDGLMESKKSWNLTFWKKKKKIV